MPEQETEYEGKQVRFDDDEEDPTLVVENRDVEVTHEEEGYYTIHLPYAHYPSLRDLAEDLVDNWPEIEPALSSREGDGE